MADRRSVEERFWAKVDKSRGPDACWPWLAAINIDGYGRFTPWFGVPQESAHRIVYKWLVGPIPPGMQIDHLCHRSDCAGGRTCMHRRCCNPTHLAAVSPRANTLRSATLAGMNARKTHCPRGHPFDAVNTLWVDNGHERQCRECNRARTRAWRASHR